MIRQTVVAISENPSDITKVSEYEERERMFSNVKSPFLSVNAKYATKIRGAMMKIADHTIYGDEATRSNQERLFFIIPPPRK
jgi:alpha-acetolactate decarboxylase